MRRRSDAGEPVFSGSGFHVETGVNLPRRPHSQDVKMNQELSTNPFNPVASAR